MDDPFNLSRFVEAQQGGFETAITELNAGAKESHWMWFIFPQLKGLGRSTTAQYFAIASIAEARAYHAHPLLGPRLFRCVEAALGWADRRTAECMFGSIDALKFRSCLTLFDVVEPATVFEDALKSFYEGTRDERTLALLNGVR